MVAHFSYERPKKVVLEDLRYHLEESGFIIKEYAPEDAFLFTDFKHYNDPIKTSYTYCIYLCI